ncbi:MAG: hypothetical protein KatS3mg096_885 [Candidatus Parcubacteria bacterium]|nr:MAG: hypothetical protein KatS3mg096_885 [Candidatus Parcubacteria bacterium]
MITKKIIWFYPHLRFFMGGTVHLLEQLKEIKRRGYDVSLIINTGDLQIIEKFKKEGNLKVNNLNTFCTNDFIYWIFFPIFLLADLFRIYKIINKKLDQDNSKEVVFFATLFPSNLIAFILSRLFKKKYYYYCYEPFPFFHDKEYINKQPFFRRMVLKILSFLYGWLDIIAVQKAKKIFTFNFIKRKLIKKVYNRDSIVTFLGIDTEFFRKIPDRENFVLKQYKGKYLVYHSTDYTPTKNTDKAIEIIRRVVNKEPNVLLLISSTQPNNPNKKKYIELVKKYRLEEKVKFLDLLPRDHLPYYYSASVCYLFTATLDIHSTSLPNLEAMACQTPVIRPYLKEEGDYEFHDGEAGYIVNINNYDEVANKIVDFIRNPNLRTKMGITGRKIIENKYRWESVVDKILSNI